MIIFGVRGYVRTLAMLTFVCQRCGNPSAHRISMHTRKFTLFFIPLFPISRSRSMTCTFCGQTTRLTKEQTEQMLAGATGGQQLAAPSQAAAPGQAAQAERPRPMPRQEP